MIAVIILTYNEELHLARALESVASFASQIFVIDSYSTDRTVEIAEGQGAVVLQHPFQNQAKQFNWALQNAPVTADWIMRLDADEIIEPPLAREIMEKLGTFSTDIAGINLKRKHIFLDRFIRHGGRYPLIMTRIWRRGRGRVEDRWMDEHVLVEGGRTITLDNPFADHNLHDLGYFTEKHNRYATREAVDVLCDRYRLLPQTQAISSHSTSLQASVKRFIKERIYNRIPFPISSLGYFLFRYLLQLGFLDGREGLIYHFLQGYWYRFLVGAKVLEFDRSLRPLDDAEERRTKLAEITGLRL
ncbi:glycosyltransferase family 2 protein [Rhizobium halophytocola]|uniref:Glycosyltransferase involved in cell wall biosynthesis n=1 Tax=Rhizobium halophytocola TaxID=735519 RepID=A0ABS4E0M6_9HYPH|nr:glycosyltransferase family 2 protein [Rhizobium halophytocola]MBP1851493.1 glycosyltransferase involved in cell wall biosynthesis [Rhizobium halophytocola]